MQTLQYLGDSTIKSFVKNPWFPVIFLLCIIPCGDFLLKQAYNPHPPPGQKHPETSSYALKYE